MESVAQCEPDVRRVVLLLDGPVEDIAGAQVITPEELVPDAAELQILRGIYAPYEIGNTMKPAFLLHLLEDGASGAFFIDPDIRALQPLTAAKAALAGGTGLLLTPHRVTPPNPEARDLFDGTFKAVGVYNTGFVGVTAQAKDFLEWWHRELRRDCLADIRAMHWADQRIADLAPSYFDVHVFKDRAYNVGWWNLDERPLSRRADGTWMVGGKPLVLMHYSGVRPGRPKGDLPALFWAPRNPAANDPQQWALAEQMEDEYVADLERHGSAEFSGAAYTYGTTPGGRVLSQGDRRRYRELVLSAESRGERVPSIDEALRGPWAWVNRRIDDSEVILRKVTGKVDRLHGRVRRYSS